MVTDYIRSGKWKFLICDSVEESKDFQWYVIDKLKLKLNRRRKLWKKINEEKYKGILRTLDSSQTYLFEELRNSKTGPGVYVYYHTNEPS